MTSATPPIEASAFQAGRTGGGWGDLRRVLRSCASLTLIWAVIWLAAYWADRSLPYTKPGSDIIYNAKSNYIENHKIFTADKPVKVLVLGNSKVLSGFIPDQFDRQVQGATSFNVGLPNSYYFLPQLKAMLADGNIPTHVLYMVEWRDPQDEKSNVFHYLPSDQKIMDRLFPFRAFVRDAAIFLMRSREFGGPLGSYRHGEEQVRKMEEARGYYFIEGQSRFADHRLPSDFHLNGDNAELVEYRTGATNTESFHELKVLADQYHFKIVVMPYYLRQGERGTPGRNVQIANALRPYPEFAVQGDEYFLFENRFFSDIAHLNHEGAQLYTSKIAELMNAELAGEHR